MPLKLNEHLVPPGGFVFKNDDGVVVHGDRLSALIANVVAYRSAANRAPGDPEREVTKALCKRCPSCCTGYDERPEKALAMLVAHHVHKAFMEKGQKGTRSLTTPEEAHRRAAICFGCPLRVNWAVSCGPCQANARPGIANAVEPNSVLPSTEDFACAAALDSLAISVFDNSPKRIPGAPAMCWRKLD